MSNENEIDSQITNQINNLKTVNNIWNYWAALIGLVVIVGGIVGLLLDHKLGGIICCLSGAVLLLYAETLRLHNVMMFHVGALWQLGLEQNDSLTAIEVTMDALGLYDQANEILMNEEEEID